MDDNDDVNLPAFGKPAKIEPPTQMMPSDKSMLNDSLDSLQNATPLKLEVSASEDEAGGGDASSASEKSKVSKKLNLSSSSSSVSNDKTPPSSNHRSNHHRTSSNDKSSSFSSSFKRATKIPRRNSSDDFVLGFDEVSGEVELLKQRSKTKSTPSNKSNANSPEEREPWASPSAAKRMKQSTTPRTSISPARSSSTRNEAKTSPISSSKDHSSNHKKDKPTSAENDQDHKQHIVGDSEEHSSTKAADYGKPFALGWKRELVWRVKSSGKDTADIYFISPAGKKLRSRNEILPHLKGELRIEDFSFAKEPLGVGPEYELVRHAKGLARSTSSSQPVQPVVSPNTPTMGKRVSKPKVPKGASPPPEGWTPTRALKMNNTALSSNSSKHSSSVSSATPHTNSANNRGSSSSASSSHKNKKARKFSQELQAHSKPKQSTQSHTNNDEKPSKARQESESDSAHTTAKETTANDKSSKSSSTSTSQNATKATAAATATNVDIKYPQTIAVVKGKKYVMVSKAVATSTTSDSTDSIQSDLKQIKEGIRNIKKQSAHLQNDSLLQPLTANNSSKQFAANFFGNISSGYSALICILKYLKIHERSRSAVVCKLWNLASKDTSFWETVRMKNSKVGDWAGFASALRRGETKHLDLRKMLVPSSRSDDMWLKFCEQIGTVCTLEMIDMCRCSSQVVESLFQTNKNLRVFNALAINDNSIDLQHIDQLKNLQELRLRPCDSAKLKSGLKPLQSLKKLKHLSITGIRNLGAQDIDIIAELTGLQSLELGECGQFDATFASKVLPQLKQLQRLRLENNQSCCTLEILDAITNMPELIQLELVNFDIKPGFDVKLSNCVHIQKLLIIPTYISQSATTNNIVLSAVQKVAKTLKVFTWGVTVELLRVTALYVDQCEGSTKKEKQHFDECIPVLKPVPGSLAIEDDANEENDDMKMDVDANSEHDGSDVPQIEIIPLDKVEMILANNLPQTKFTIVKIPYHATCKQQLVD